MKHLTIRQKLIYSCTNFNKNLHPAPLQFSDQITQLAWRVQSVLRWIQGKTTLGKYNLYPNDNPNQILLCGFCGD